MPDLWLPGAQRFSASRSWAMDGGGARYANWHSTENDPAASAADLARYLIGIRAEPHLVWNPWTGDICQLVPANRGGSVLKAGNHKGTTNIGIECIGRAGVAGKRPLSDSPMKGFDRILDWLRSWGVPDVWPAGAPLPYPQSAGLGNPQRGRWGASGHYGHSQWPANDHGDPGVVDMARFFGPGVTPQPDEEDEVSVLPTIQPGRDAGHPASEQLFCDLVNKIDPQRHLTMHPSQATARAQACKDFEAFFKIPGSVKTNGEGDGYCGTNVWRALLSLATGGGK